MTQPGLASRIIFSVVTLATAIGPMVADFNRTHATNPLWTRHARFHVVWQVLTQAGVSAVILFLVWMPGNEQMLRNWAAVALIYVWGAAFLGTCVSMRLFDGSLHDVNGYLPFRFQIPGGGVWVVDKNALGAVNLMVIHSYGVYRLAVQGG